MFTGLARHRADLAKEGAAERARTTQERAEAQFAEACARLGLDPDPKAIMGTLGLWSSRVGMPGVAGSIAARRAHNLSASTSAVRAWSSLARLLDGGS
jgi:hypothetical protein